MSAGPAPFPVWRRLLLFGGSFFVLMAPGQFLTLPGTPPGSAGILVAAVLAGWFVLHRDGFTPSALGFHGPLKRAGREMGLGLALGLGVGLLAVSVMVVGGALRWTPEGGAGFLAATGSSLWFFLVPAAAEEALFRGYPLQAAARAWGPKVAVLGSSVLFAALHGWNPGVSGVGLINIAAAGVFLGVLYLRTASLWWATGAHLGWNWSHGFLADLPVSGLDVVGNPLVEAVLTGPTWLNGGAFGPEGSVPVTLAVLAAATWCWKTDKLNPSGERKVREILTPAWTDPQPAESGE